MAARGSPEDWFRSLPPITRTYLLLALGTTAGVSFGIIRNVMTLLLSMDLVWYKFEVWRLLTCFCFFREVLVSLRVPDVYPRTILSGVRAESTLQRRELL